MNRSDELKEARDQNWQPAHAVRADACELTEYVFGSPRLVISLLDLLEKYRSTCTARRIPRGR